METKKIMIFGAGFYGKMAFEQYPPDRVTFFIDNDKDKQGTFFCGKKIICLCICLRGLQMVLDIDQFSTSQGTTRLFSIMDVQVSLFEHPTLIEMSASNSNPQSLGNFTEEQLE